MRAKIAWLTLASATVIASVVVAGAMRQGPSEAIRAIAIACDTVGNLIVIEGGRVRRLTPDGAIRTIAGVGRQGYRGDGGSALEAGFEFPVDVAIDAKGNVYIADNLAHRVRVIAPDGKIQTFAGTGEPGYGGDGGPAVRAKLQSPVRVALDAAGNLYIADSGNARIRKVNAAGVITTVAGIGRDGFSGDNGPAITAAVNQLSGLAVDSAGNIYLADGGNARIRKITVAGVISTIAGNGDGVSAGDGGPAARASVQPFSLAVDTAGNSYIVEVNRIRKVSTDGVIRTIVGTGSPGFSGDGGPAPAALLRGPTAVAVDTKGNLYIADTLNGRIRKVLANGTISTLAGATPAPMPDSLTTSIAPRGRGTPAATSAGLLGGIATAPVSLPTVAPSGRPSLLETRLGMIPRPPLTAVKDCGHVPKDTPEKVVACVQESLLAKLPFFASFEQKGVTPIIVGMGGTAPDSVVQVTFENAGNGARVSAAKDCRDPRFTIVAGAVQIICKQE